MIRREIPKYQLGKVIEIIGKAVSKSSKSGGVKKYLTSITNLWGGKKNAEAQEGMQKLLDLEKRGVDFSKLKNASKDIKEEFYDAFSKLMKGRRASTDYVARKNAFWSAEQKAKRIAATQQTAAQATQQATQQAAAQATQQAAEEAVKRGLLSRIYGGMKRHPWLTTAGVVGLTNGTTRDGLLTGLQYYFTPASRWDQIGQSTPSTGSTQKLRLNDGTVVPVSMGSDGVLTFAQNDNASGQVDDIDALIQQAIAADVGTNPQDAAAISPAVGGYTTNEDFNDIFENDAWDQ